MNLKTKTVAMDGIRTGGTDSKFVSMGGFTSETQMFTDPVFKKKFSEIYSMFMILNSHFTHFDS